MHKGMLTNSLSVIAKGLANVFINEQGVVIAELGGGDIFGEHSAMTGGKANAPSGKGCSRTHQHTVTTY